VDLRPWGTRSLKERHGWFHDLRTPGIAPGRYRLHGIEVTVFAEDAPHPRAVVVLGDQEEGKGGLPSEVAIPLTGRLESLFVLHTTYRGNDNTEVGKCSLRFDDGSIHAIDLFAPPHPLRENCDLSDTRWTSADWWPAWVPPDNPLSRPVPVTGFDEIYLATAVFSLLRIRNPCPGKTVAEVAFGVGPGSGACLAVFALTVAR